MPIGRSGMHENSKNFDSKGLDDHTIDYHLPIFDITTMKNRTTLYDKNMIGSKIRTPDLIAIFN